MVTLSRMSIAAFLCLTACSSSHEESKIHCINSSAGSCVISMVALLANPPSDYRGLHMLTAGYLVSHGNKFYIFPSEEWAPMAYYEHAIEIIPRDEGDIAAMMHLNNRLARVAGTIEEAHCSNNCWGHILLDSEPDDVAFYGGSPTQRE